MEATVDAILAQLKDFPRVAAQGTIEERKEFVRVFVARISIDPLEARGSVKLRKLPVPNAAPTAIQLESLSPI